MAQMVADEKILSYADVLLRASDVALLAAREWLNDTLIEFYVEYLWKAVLREHPKIALIGPSIAFCLMHCQTDDERKFIISSLDLPRKELILFVLNDNEDTTCAGGGSHWSTFLFSRTHSLFLHLDSNNGSNGIAAFGMMEAVKNHLGGCASLYDLHTFYCPQQTNAYDCGLYVLAFFDTVCSVVLDNKGGLDVGKFPEERNGQEGIVLDLNELRTKLFDVVTPKFVHFFRLYMLNLIHDLAPQQKGIF